MKAFVINLDKDVERMNMFEKNYNSSEYLQWERVSGKLGKDVPDNKLTTPCKYLCTESMKGCAWSHIKTWERIVNDQIDMALIMEDDVVPISSDYENEVISVIDDTPTDFDVLTLHNSMNSVTDMGWVFRNLTSMLGIYNPMSSKVSKKLYRPQCMYGTMSYIVSLKGAKKLLQLIDKISFHVDITIFSNYNNLIIYSIDEPIFKPRDNNDSNNSTSNFFNDLIPGTPLGIMIKTDFMSVCNYNINALTVLGLLSLIMIIGSLLKRPLAGFFIAITVVIVILIVVRVMCGTLVRPSVTKKLQKAVPIRDVKVEKNGKERERIELNRMVVNGIENIKTEKSGIENKLINTSGCGRKYD